MVRKLNEQGKDRPNIVIPTNRSLGFFKDFLDDWKEEFAGCHIIVVEDRPKKKLKKLLGLYPEFTYEVYDWRDIDRDLRENTWIISKQTDCVRNYGFLIAHQNKAKFIVTIDDDTQPTKGHIQQFYKRLFTKSHQTPFYFSTMNGRVPRGDLTLTTPKEVVVSHGTWLGTPDFSARQQIDDPICSSIFSFYEGQIPQGCIYSMCGMNIAFKTHWTRHMYFPIMGLHHDYPIDRCGDIWCGYYSKFKADREKKLHVTGSPYVHHYRASNVWTNLIKEENGRLLGDQFIQTMLLGKEPIIEKVYFNKLKLAYKIWNELIDESDNE